MKKPPPDPGPTPVETAQANLKAAQDAVDMDGTDAEMLEDYQAVLKAADALVAALKDAGEDTTAAARISGNAKAKVDNLTMKIAAADKKAADDAAKAMAALTAKLWNGIGEAPLANTISANRQTDTRVTDADVVHIKMKGATDSTPLEENEDVTVAALNGWTGSEHTKKTDAGTYTARLYANIDAPKVEDKTFQEQYSANIGTTGDAKGVLDTATTSLPANAPKVAGSEFSKFTAGTHSLKAKDNPYNSDWVLVDGSFHGVAGQYICKPSGTNNCGFKVAAKGFRLGAIDSNDEFQTTGVEWTFKPNSLDDKIAATPSTDPGDYEYFGWWILDNNGDATVGVLVGENRSAQSTPNSLTSALLGGTATYKGGAAGKYAVSAGKDSDAGHFTADAELTADFSDFTIAGTIDNFTGGDGKARDWSVSLKKADIADNGLIRNKDGGGSDATLVEPTDSGSMTAWSMGGTASDAGGEWRAQMYDHDNTGTQVPKVVLGEFHALYGITGRMVGAFGATTDQ